MKMHTEESNVEVGFDESDNFYMEMTPEALELLSAGAYKDRVLAPIREISANAYDAHVAANKADIPFEVQIPTSLDPNFYIRDFGTGIDPNKFKSVYTGYFMSSKKDSNDYIGCMGIGSKSPFAYVDTFNVSNYWNGKVYIYSCYKDEKRKPAITLMGTTDTDEPNGLKVSFPVKKEDMYLFREKAKVAFNFYKVKPIIKGHNITFDEPKYIFKNEKIGVLAQKSYYDSSTSFVVMGNIAYQIESDSMQNLDVISKSFINHGVHLFIPIGSVSVAISRETLSFDKQTISFLEEFIPNCIEDIKKKMELDVIHIKNTWDARVFCNENKNNVLYSLLNANSSRNEFFILWNGQNVKDNIALSSYAQTKPSSIELCSLTSKEPSSYRYSSEKNIVTNGLRRRYVSNIYFSRNVKFFIDDVNTGTYSAIKRHLDSSSDESVYLLSSDKAVSFLDSLEVPKENIFYVSSIEKPERKPREKGPKKEKTLLQKYDKSYNSLKPEDVDLKNSGGIYFEQKYQSVKINGDFVEDKTFLKLIKRFISLDLKEDVYTVRPSDKEKLKNRPNWKDGDEFILNFIDGLTAVREQAQYFQCCLNTKFLVSINRYKNFFKTAVFSSISKEISDAKAVVDKFLLIEKDPKISNYISIVEHLQFKNPKLSLDSDFSKFKDASVFSAVENKYPLLKYLSIDCSNDKFKSDTIVNYLNMIDNHLNFSVIKDAV